MKSSTSGSVRLNGFGSSNTLSSPGQMSVFTCDELIKNLYDNVYLAPFGRKFIKIAFNSELILIQLIGSTRPKLEV